MMTPRNLFILHCSLIRNFGPGSTGHLLARLGDTDVADVYGMSVADVQALTGFQEKKATLLVDGLRNGAVLEQEIELIKRYDIQWATIEDEQYPKLLKTIAVPPSVLYWRGTLPGQQTLAIIGSREATGYALRAINAMVPPLVGHGFTIVSGGALGADTMAHNATLQAGGVTVAVLGSGLLHPYPGRNEQLFKAIVAGGGAVMSGFPLRDIPMAQNFPARNRIVSGLSRGVLVVQAAAKSGALITAAYALEQGRDVFAVPGSIEEPLSMGCHHLIQQGEALLVTSAQDIVASLGGLWQGGFVDKMDQSVQMSLLDEDPVVLACREPKSLEELIVLVKSPYLELQSRVFTLQIEGKIRQNFAGLWEKV